MLRALRPFFICLLGTWIALIAAAVVYSKQHAHSSWILFAALPAFMCEAVFYLAAVFEETREFLRRLRFTRVQAAVLWLSGLAPYLIFSLSMGRFQPNAFYLLAALTGALSFWHVILPRRDIYDAGFLVAAAAPQVTKVFTRIYLAPDPQISLLGHLAWIHVGIVALLLLREWKPGPFGFWPSPKEWQVGMFVFLLSIAPIIALAHAVHDAAFVLPQSTWWRMVATGLGTFLGIFWVVALSEELFFRGVVQRAVQNHSRNPVLAIVVAALLFGSAHLWVHQFPNWHRAAVAAGLGLACGAAYWWAGSVRASMVTHALVVVTWRLFFR